MEKREVRLNLKIQKSIKETIKEQAEKQRLSMTEYISRLILADVEKEDK